jgi:hypothetical protein
MQTRWRPVSLDGLLVRASAGAASFRRHSTLQECRCEAEKAIDTDPGAASRKQAAARRRATEDRERRVRAALAVTEELHAKQQEAARKEAERAARKAPQDVAADAKGEAPAHRSRIAPSSDHATDLPRSPKTGIPWGPSQSDAPAAHCDSVIVRIVLSERPSWTGALSMPVRISREVSRHLPGRFGKAYYAAPTELAD